MRPKTSTKTTPRLTWDGEVPPIEAHPPITSNADPLWQRDVGWVYVRLTNAWQCGEVRPAPDMGGRGRPKRATAPLLSGHVWRERCRRLETTSLPANKLLAGGSWP